MVSHIPVFNLFGETGAFPDVVHCERIWDRARLHDWLIAPHRHREMAQMFLMRQGVAQVRLDGRESRLEDGEFLFVPAQVVHGFAFRQGSEGLVLSFPLNVVSGAGPAALQAQLARAFIGRADGPAAGLADRLAEVFAATGAFRGQILVALAHALLASLAEIGLRADAAGDTLVRRRMAEFDRLLARHLQEGWQAGWGASAFASALSITPGHLNRICRMATGEGAARHIETARMTEASRLLAFTRLPVAEIGYRLGYADPAYFSRRFRSARGDTPSEYRARFGT